MTYKGGLRIALISNYLNHGHVYDEWYTGFAVLAARSRRVESVTVLAPVRDSDDADLPHHKIRVVDAYDTKKPLSLLRVISLLRKSRPDLAIFSMGPTGYGPDNLPNLIGVFMPVIAKFVGVRTVGIIQGSSLLMDASALGYNKRLDWLRMRVLRLLEGFVFTRVDTFVQLPVHLARLRAAVRRSRARGVIVQDYIDGIATVYLNEAMDRPVQRGGEPQDHRARPVVLLHGYWGPQKDLEMALRPLRRAKESGVDFSLIVSGTTNVHFPEYASRFRQLMQGYSDVVTKYVGYVPEKEVMDLFLKADLILLPYRTPGGHSGVLETASLLGLPAICVTFPEFVDEVKPGDNIRLVRPTEFGETILATLRGHADTRGIVDVPRRVAVAQANVEKFIAAAAEDS